MSDGLKRDSLEVDKRVTGSETFTREDTSKDQDVAVKSFGVKKSELLAQQCSNVWFRAFFAFAIYLCAFAYSLDGNTRYVFQTRATASYDQHSLLSTINVIRSVAAAASQPVYARLSDVIGRLELTIVSIIFYSMGTVIESQAYDIQRFAAGSVFYQVGYSGIILMLEILVADLSTMNWRLLAMLVPTLPFLKITWFSGNVTEALNKHHSWNYAIGIWAFIFPLCSLPILGCMIYMRWQASKTDEWKQVNQEEHDSHVAANAHAKPYQDKLLHTEGFVSRTLLKTRIFFIKSRYVTVDLFWRLDIIGVIFVICIFGFILVPLTISGGTQSSWAKASSIVPLVIGVVLIPLFVLWEGKFAKEPILPYKLLKERGVWAALIISTLINFVSTMPDEYLYSVLMIGMGASDKAATRILSLSSFVGTVVAPIVAIVIIFVKRNKPFIIFGCCVWFASMGMFYHYRGDNNGLQRQYYIDGVIAAKCVMGFGTGFFTYNVMLSIQTCTNHEYMAVLIALSLAVYNIGLGLGAAVSGAIWTQQLYGAIESEMKKLGLDTELATAAYSDPFSFIKEYGWGTQPRIAVVLAYAKIQRKLIIVGLVLCVPLVAASLCLRNHKLLPVYHMGEVTKEEAEREGKTVVVVNKYDDDPIVNFFKKLIGRGKKTDSEV